MTEQHHSHLDDLIWQANHPQLSKRAFRCPTGLMRPNSPYWPSAMSVLDNAVNAAVQAGCDREDILDDIDYILLPTAVHSVFVLHAIASNMGTTAACQVDQPGIFSFESEQYNVLVAIGPSVTEIWLDDERHAA